MDLSARFERPDTHGWILIAVVVLAVVLRFSFLGTFPEVEADEGLWTNSTKNFYLFSDWFMDGRTHVFLSPLFHALSLASFYLFGPSIEAARVVSAAAGVGSVVLLYSLALRLTGDRWLALLAAAILALEQWSVLISRRALIEPLQLFFALAAAVAAAGPGRGRIALGGALFALALLAKLNVAVIGVVLGAFLLLRGGSGDVRSWTAGAVDVVIFGAVSLGIAGAVYGGLYLSDPERFVRAFVFEMEGAHFVAEGEPLFQRGRWGLVPVMAARSILELIREAPLLFSFAAVGAVIAVAERRAGGYFFLLWAFVGLAFPLVQMYQPARYFYFALPGLALLAAVMMMRVASGSEVARSVQVGTVAIFLAFSGAYNTMNFLANRGNTVHVVEAWVRQNVDREARVLVAGYYATNLPNRAYAHYHIAPSAEDLVHGIEEFGIDYVIWDEREWQPAHREVLEDRFPRIHSFGFGHVYRVKGTR